MVLVVRIDFFFLFKIIPVRHLFDDKIRHNCFSEAKQPMCLSKSRDPIETGCIFPFSHRIGSSSSPLFSPDLSAV